MQNLDKWLTMLKKYGAFGLIAITLIFLIGCFIGENYKFQLFSYPPESVPHEKGWSYRGSVTFNFKGSIMNESTKSIEIIVTDTTEKECLNDKFELTCGYVDALTEWTVFDTLTILFYNEEVGKPVKVPVEGTSDSVYVNVIKEINYLFNHSINKFER